jgi:hypothetical protein
MDDEPRHWTFMILIKNSSIFTPKINNKYEQTNKET